MKLSRFIDRFLPLIVLIMLGVSLLGCTQDKQPESKSGTIKRITPSKKDFNQGE